MRDPLSQRNVEDLPHERGIDITHDMVRVRAMRSFRHRRWHLAEVIVKFNSEKRNLWRAVDHEREALESSSQDAGQEGGVEPQIRVAKFLRKSLKRHGVVETIVTDRLASNGAAAMVSVSEVASR